MLQQGRRATISYLNEYMKKHPDGSQTVDTTSEGKTDLKDTLDFHPETISQKVAALSSAITRQPVTSNIAAVSHPTTTDSIKSWRHKQSFHEILYQKLQIIIIKAAHRES